MKYEKTQTGWLMIVIFSLIIIQLTLAYLYQLGDKPLPLGVFIALALLFIVLLLCFYQLKIRVDQYGIHVIYGIGLIHIKINPQKIYNVSVIKTPWYYGLGIRFTGKGMLYNIQGLNAIEISYLDGKQKTALVGSNEPELLKAFIEKEYEQR